MGTPCNARSWPEFGLIDQIMVKLIDIQLVANLLKALSSVPISRNELNWLKMRVSGWTLTMN